MNLLHGWFRSVAGLLLLVPGVLSAQIAVPETPPPTAKPQLFHDDHFGVHFKVPEGWTLARRDRQVSTFHLDARTASPGAMMRSVASIQFNPYPYSTFSGALFYFSVEPHATEVECARQATVGLASAGLNPSHSKDVQDIGGMSFAHGHDEHGKICVEARDEVYTAYRKGACYRFDLAMNTFCSISSGAADMTQAELQQVDQRMADILSTVQLDWEKAGPHTVPAPHVPETPVPTPAGQHSASVRARGAPAQAAAGSVPRVYPPA